jgi:Immunity protein 50
VPTETTPDPARQTDSTLSPLVRNRIRDANNLIDVYGEWPTFSDAEIISVALERGNHLAIAANGDWASRVAPSMTAKVMVFDSRCGNIEDCKYRLVTLRFNGLTQFNMQWFSYQNPIAGIGLSMEIVPGQTDPSIHVEWGGTAMGHEADFYCDSIDVLSIEPFLPPRLRKSDL